MVKREILDRVERCMRNPSNIRNLSVIAHVDHGKSTLADSLVARAGLVRVGSTDRWLDIREDEKNRTITIKSTSVSMVFDCLPVRAKIDPKTQDWKHKRIQRHLDTQQQEEEPSSHDSNDEHQNQEHVHVNSDDKPIQNVSSSSSESSSSSSSSASSSSSSPQPAPREEFLINLIDCPGHVDFSSEVTASLRTSDGALVVVDCISGVCVQTETVLKQALAERIRPVLFVNKLDRMISLNMDGEDAYQRLARSIESVNVILSVHSDSALGSLSVHPQNNTVAFGSALHGWGFLLSDFARILSTEFDISIKKMMKKLWGENYYSFKEKKWYTVPQDSSGNKLERAFVSFVYNPLVKLTNSLISDNEMGFAHRFMKRIGLTMSINNKPLSSELSAITKPVDRLKLYLSSWIPSADALLEMFVQHLPSPITAQRYRVQNLYSGPQDDETAAAIRACDPAGPLVIYVSKMIPTSDNKRFYAFGRVFSGTALAGLNVRILGPDYTPDSKNDLFIASLSSVCIMMGPHVESASNGIGAGNMCGLVGIDSHIGKQATIVGTSLTHSHTFVGLKYSVSPVVRIAVNVAHSSDLNKLMNGLKRLSKSDPLVQVYMTPSGEHIIAGAGELHLEICLKDLQEMYMGTDTPLIISKPLVSYCETITSTSKHTACAKSNNKHNRIYMTSTPLSNDFVQDVDQDRIHIYDIKSKNMKMLSSILTEKYGWDVNDAKKVWSFSLPSQGGVNVLIDRSRGVQYLHDVSDLIVNAFTETCSVKGGVLTGEPMRGCRFEVVDAKLHADKVHRSISAIAPATQRCMYACELLSNPTLCEPIYKCTITVANTGVAEGVYQTLRARRGTIAELDESSPSSSNTSSLQSMTIVAYLPVSESFGFASLLSSNTGGQAFPQLVFSHWANMDGNPMDSTSSSGRVVSEIRSRKGLSSALPSVSDFHDDIKI